MKVETPEEQGHDPPCDFPESPEGRNLLSSLDMKMQRTSESTLRVAAPIAPVVLASWSPRAKYLTRPTPPKKGSGAHEVACAPLLRWAMGFQKSDRPTAMAVLGPADARVAMIRSYQAPRFAPLRPGAIEDVDRPGLSTWIQKGAVEDFLDRVAAFRIPNECRGRLELEESSWELLWGLMRIETLIVEDDLRPMVEHSFYLMAEVHKALWEARFLDRENADKSIVRRFVTAMSRWLRGAVLSEDDMGLLTKAGVTRRIERDEEKVDAVCFLLTLAAQNALVNRVVLLFDGIEEATTPAGRPALKGLHLLLTSIDRWVRNGDSPMGALLGFSGTDADFASLRRLHPRLAERVEACGEWNRVPTARRY